MRLDFNLNAMHFLFILFFLILSYSISIEQNSVRFFFVSVFQSISNGVVVIFFSLILLYTILIHSIASRLYTESRTRTHPFSMCVYFFIFFLFMKLFYLPFFNFFKVLKAVSQHLFGVFFFLFVLFHFALVFLEFDIFRHNCSDVFFIGMRVCVSVSVLFYHALFDSLCFSSKSISTLFFLLLLLRENYTLFLLLLSLQSNLNDRSVCRFFSTLIFDTRSVFFFLHFLRI